MRKKVVIGLSGGVDSAVAALLLRQQAYEVHGLYLITCPGYEVASEKAQVIADQLSIPLTCLDIQEAFHETVIQAFARSYYAGETPSPCLNCNRQIKWKYMLNFADAIGADYVATGHYARVTQNENGLFELRKGLDPQKDQAYMLSRLNQEDLARTLFPLGAQTKHNVRAIAEDFRIIITKSEESQDLCFLHGTNYRSFLKEHFNFQEPTGEVRLLDGTLLGKHSGLSQYTIGQRKGLPAHQHPLFVIEKNIETNTLIVGAAEDLGRNHFRVRELNWISGQPPQNTSRLEMKIRYQAKPVLCDIKLEPDQNAEVLSHTMLRDITPGQFAVFYQDDQVLGSGVINAYLLDFSY